MKKDTAIQVFAAHLFDRPPYLVDGSLRWMMRDERYLQFVRNQWVNLGLFTFPTSYATERASPDMEAGSASVVRRQCLSTKRRSVTIYGTLSAGSGAHESFIPVTHDSGPDESYGTQLYRSETSEKARMRRARTRLARFASTQPSTITIAKKAS